MAGRGLPRRDRARVPGTQGGPDDRHHCAGRGVEDRPPGRPAARPERVRARRTDRQLQYVTQEMDSAGGRVGHGGGAQYPRLAPAARRDPDVRTGRDAVPHGDGERGEAETFGAYESQTEVGQGGDGFGGHRTGAAAGGAQDEPVQAGDGLVPGDQGAVVVGRESRAAWAARQVVDTDEDVVPRLSGAVRRLVVPGPRASPRHTRTSPPCSLLRR
jgi:hypothetical protein